MTDLDNSKENQTNEIFNKYIMSVLERSSNFSQSLARQGYNSIQLFLTLLTALTGGLIVVITTVDDEFLALLIVTLIFAFAAGFGILTYLWILASIFQQKQEVALRFFLEKYFRDSNPFLFEKYGLSKLLRPYSRIYDKKFFSVTGKVSVFSLLILAVFDSILLAAACYTGWLAFSKGTNLGIAAVAGIILFSVLLFLERFLQKRISIDMAVAQEIFETYHMESDKENSAKGGPTSASS